MSAASPKYSDVNRKDFGSGGSAAQPALGNQAGMVECTKSLMGTVSAPLADTAALTASLAKDRKDGMLVVLLSDYSIWVWKANSATAADGTHIAPTDVGAGNGRWVRAVAGPA